MSFCLILLAAGDSKRFASKIPKPFIKIGITYNGNPEDITIEIKKPSIKIDYGRAPKKGKTIYCLNKDLTYPAENKELPGNGAVVKIIEDSIESIVKSFGKPDYFYTQYFVDSKIKVDYVVGDRVDTDINFAKKINAYSILVTSGVSNFLPEDLADLKLNSFSEIIPFII